MGTSFLFYLAFAALLTHELDAVHKREWRLLIFLRSLPENTARRVFIFAHVPLIAALCWLVAYPTEAVQVGAQSGLDIFMIVHAGLHRRLEHLPAYGFNSPLSRSLIYGSALLGLAHLILVLW